jgi:uncharacterized protein YbaR (Trm112 family)
MLKAKMNSQLLEILRCPQDHTVLAVADGELIQRVNNAIGDGRILSASGEPRTQPIDGGLVRAAGDVLYPIVDGVPLLLRDEAIVLNEL